MHDYTSQGATGMNPHEELFERFGRQLIERVRDKEISYAEGFLDQQAPLSHKYKDELGGMSPAQIETMKKLAVLLIDGTLHDFLIFLENANWIHLRLEGEDIALEDIRQAASGDLQGYVSIWAEKYSKKRLLDL
jgi:hypothetical protein